MTRLPKAHRQPPSASPSIDRPPLQTPPRAGETARSIFIYIHIYTYTYTPYIHIFTYTYECVRECLWGWKGLLRVYTYIFVCVCVRICLCISIHACICIRIFMCISMYMYMHRYTYMHMFACIYIRTCVYMYMYVWCLRMRCKSQRGSHNTLSATNLSPPQHSLRRNTLSAATLSSPQQGRRAIQKSRSIQ